MGFGGFVDPAEAAAAKKAAQAMEAARAQADARTEALATAIVEGFGLVANAILTASGRPAWSSGIPGPMTTSTDAQVVDANVSLAAEVCRAHGAADCDSCDEQDGAQWVHPCDVVDKG